MRLVMKFGGTSVGNEEALEKVASLVRRYADANELVVVTSALNGVTNRLIEVADRASHRDEKCIAETIEGLRNRHERICRELLDDSSELETVMARVGSELGELERALTGIRYLGELTPRSRDYVLSFGERLSTWILSAILRQSGVRAQRFTGQEAGIVTDASFGNATPLMEATKQRVKGTLSPLIEKGTLPVVAGFIAATDNGLPTTLGRGGSDYTATVLGVSLAVDEVWVWTDVDGIMTADPKIEPNARTIPRISFVEAMEMSHFAAKSMHPRALEPAAEVGLPVRVKNTFNPNGPDTLILREQQINPAKIVKAVTSVKEASVVTVSGAGMHGAPGTAARILSVLGENEINVMMISQSSSEASISMVVARASAEKGVRALRQALLGDDLFREINAESDVSVVAVVGEGMKGTPGIAARLFRAIADQGVNVRMIAQGSSELNVSFVVRQEDAQRSVRALHKEFNLDISNNESK